MIRVGLLTSWQTACGVYQYSRHLADALDRHRQGEVEVWVLASRNDPGRHLPEPAPYPAVECFQIGHWRQDGVYAIDADRIVGMGLDVLHVSYQSILFNQEPLGDLARRFGGVTALTFHDNCVRPDFPVQAFDLHYTHRRGVACGTVLPFGIEDRPLLIRTFGLGRSRCDIIERACDELGYRFESAASHEGPGGGQRWVPAEQLHRWLREADAIVQWYDDVAAAGSSQAARTAIATHRPVAVNDVTWFADLPDHAPPNFWKLPNDPDALRGWLAGLRSRYVDECSWGRVADRLVSDYREVLNREAA